MNLITPKALAERLQVPVKALGMLERRDPSFPRAIRVTQRTLRWVEEEVNEWLLHKKERTHHGQTDRTG